ncbi:MAG: phosphomevalonate kinase [Neobacillus sp.]|jgi:phosphomevalonate kinase|nr:phosphomevalonate kinase [Neobacillus sp.]
MTMTYSSYRVKVPGKLLIAGEYAILEPKQKAIVVAVNRYITAYIEPSNHNQLILPQLGLDHVTWDSGEKKVQFNVNDPRLNFIKSSITIMNQFLKENSFTLQPFRLTIKSELDDPKTGMKYGLGSSAAVVVAVISAMLSLYDKGKDQPLQKVFKLAAIAHLLTQRNGSGVDIAASTFGGWIGYSSYNPSWVLSELMRMKNLTRFIQKPWPNLFISRLHPPESLIVAVGWTKEPAATGPMINKVKEFWDFNLSAYSKFLEKSTISVSQMMSSFKEKDCSSAVSSLQLCRQALLQLSKQADVTIETDKLKQLSELAQDFGSGKSSGAGGGDCGIAFLNDERKLTALHKAWNNAGIIPLKLTSSKVGVAVTEYNCEPSLKEYYVGV